MTPVSRRAVVWWLFVTAAAVFLMALIGAVTRLTESGLSIVEWKPVAGALPPMGDAAWAAEFDKYRESPQYLKVNRGMTIEEFKYIFFWEWLHRLFGRLIGVVYALPLALFWWRGVLPQEKKKYFLGILGLGLAQGFMGWYMVQSGLVDQPAVSHYRLAAHLMLAFLIYGCLIRLALDLALPPQAGAERASSLRGFLRGMIVLSAAVMTWGAFVAGLDAGLLYNTFPKMDAHWIPPELAQHKPLWRAFFEEPATVQFTHRVLALLLFFKAAFMAWRGLKLSPPPRMARAFYALAAVIGFQVALGVATLLSHVHIAIATLHQAGALLLLGVLVWLLHEIPPREKKG